MLLVVHGMAMPQQHLSRGLQAASIVLCAKCFRGTADKNDCLSIAAEAGETTAGPWAGVDVTKASDLAWQQLLAALTGFLARPWQLKTCCSHQLSCAEAGKTPAGPREGVDVTKISDLAWQQLRRQTFTPAGMTRLNLTRALMCRGRRDASRALGGCGCDDGLRSSLAAAAAADRRHRQAGDQRHRREPCRRPGAQHDGL